MLFVALCLTGVVKAQFSSSSEIYAYLESGTTIEATEGKILVSFQSGEISVVCPHMSYIQNTYKDDPSLTSFFKRNIGGFTPLQFKYDSSNSTYKRVTYSKYYPESSGIWGRFPAHSDYYSFAKDKETIVKWSSNSNHKKYYSRIALSEFAPKSQNKDFLYE